MKRFLKDLLGTTPTTLELLKLGIGAPITFVASLAQTGIVTSFILLLCSLAFAADAGYSLGRRIKE